MYLSEQGKVAHRFLWSVKGGVGTTFLATCLALFSQEQTILCESSDDIFPLCGLQGEPSTSWEVFFSKTTVEEAFECLPLQILDKNVSVLSYDPNRFSQKCNEFFCSTLIYSSKNIVFDLGVQRLDVETILSDEHFDILNAHQGSQDFQKSTLTGTITKNIFYPEYLREYFSPQSQSILVLRSCYLSLRRACMLPYRADGILLLEEPERNLSVADVEDIVGVPVIASIPYDTSYARIIDAGTLLTQRFPKSLQKSLQSILR